MGIRNDLPRIPTNEKPSFWNLDTAMGFFVGGLLGNLLVLGVGFALLGTAMLAASPAIITAGLPWLLAASVAGLGIQIAGTVMGATEGKKRMQDELVNGRVVHEPTYLNKGTVLGLVAASFAMSVASFLFPPIALLGFPAAIVGGVAGSVWRKDEMQSDVVTAQAIKAQSHGQTRAPRQHAISQEEAQQLDARMKQGHAHANHAAQVEQSREHVAPHQLS